MTPDGQYAFLLNPFGIVNSGAFLVPGLKKVLEELSGSYTHDIVVYSDSWEEHLRTLRELPGRMRRTRSTARPMKCFLGEDRMEFLGHHIVGDVITLSRDDLEKVWN